MVAGSPCVMGAVMCGGAEGVCMPTAKSQANGTVCGTDQVCLDGACSACAAGTACPLPDKPCRAGVIDCTGGKPACMEMGNAAPGAACGNGMVCKDGSCGACAAGDPCVPPNACHKGALDCTGGTARCNDTGTPVSAGGSCGANKVCGPDGSCLACMAGAACDTKDPCKIGKIDCTTGASACVESENAPNGKSCGMGKVCSEGMCVACQAGMTCTPANKCHTGMLVCSAGTAECKDSGKNAASGAMCGDNMYCSNGACGACTPGASCMAANPCKTGTTACTTGTSQCTESGNQPNGHDCGNGKVCNNGGCVACQADMPCEPAPCKVGTTVCTSGKSECKETAGMAADGSKCGTMANFFCHGGSCTACNEGATCQTGNDCTTGKLSCTTGTGVCKESPAANGKNCGGTNVCLNSKCVACMPGSPASCQGTDSKKTCQSDGTFKIDPCPRGCGGGACCGAGTEAKGGSCQSCGAQGQACCTVATPPCSGTLVCPSGTCQPPCGGAGQACCNGTTRPCQNGCGTETCMGGSFDTSRCDTCTSCETCSSGRCTAKVCGANGCNPASGQCRVCVPGSAPTCMGGVMKTCNGAGSGFDTSDLCQDPITHASLGCNSNGCNLCPPSKAFDCHDTGPPDSQGLPTGQLVNCLPDGSGPSPTPGKSCVTVQNGVSNPEPCNGFVCAECHSDEARCINNNTAMQQCDGGKWGIGAVNVLPCPGGCVINDPQDPLHPFCN